MGRFSKFVKKFTRPISKVLDKVVPNELKPALPYLAAFAPYMLPAGFAGGSGLSALFRRGLLSGGANLTSQLAQEGSEGDFNPLSLGLASLQGAMTADGAGNYFRGKINPGEAVKIPGGNMPGQGMGGFKYDTSGLTGLDKAKNFMLKGGAKLADLAGGAQETLSDPFAADVTLKELATAGAAPFSEATGQLAYADANRLNKQFAKDEAIQMATDAAAAAGASAADIAAVTASMTNYGYDQSEIDNIISQFFSNGGRVGYNVGGRIGYGMGGDIMEGIMGMFNKGDKEPDFNTMAETVETVEMKPKEYLFDNKLKFEVGPGENEQEAVLNALFADEEGLIPEDRKQDYYNLYINNLYRSGDMDRSDYDGYIEEGILTKPKYNIGGSVLPKNMDMENLMAYEPGVPTTGDLYDMNNPDYKGINKKIIIEFIEEGIPLGYSSPEEYFDDFYGPFAKKNKKTMTAKNGGIMNNYNMGGSVLPNGVEMDYRGGGFIPMGSAEKADDVPARVSKNEFVMTADAVRAAGGGSVNKGAQKMYQLMNNLEARV